MVWRNSNLDFSSLKSLLRSLSLMPNKPYLTMSPEAEDERILKDLSKKPSIIDNFKRERSKIIVGNLFNSRLQQKF